VCAQPHQRIVFKHTLLYELGMRSTTKLCWIVAVDYVSLGTTQQARTLFRSRRRFSGLGRTGPLLTSKVGLGESLFPGFRFPVVIPDSAAIYNNSAAELTEHTSCSDNCYLPRSVRERENLLADKVVLLHLVGDDLEQRSVILEKQIRVTVSQDPSTLGRQHEELVSSVRNDKCSTAIFAAP
jgi:hypothetical protein